MEQTQLLITDITEYKEPQPYLAVECDNDFIKEISLPVFFDHLFKHNTTLKEYADKLSLTQDKLYKHLEDIGYPLKDTIHEVLTTEDIEYEFISVPKSIYPTVRKYYTGVATPYEIALIEKFLELVGGQG